MTTVTIAVDRSLINTEKLTDEIRASFPSAFIGFGQGEMRATATAITELALQAIVDLHDPLILTAEQQKEAIRNAAKSEVVADTAWRSWTGNEADTWIDTNVTDLASSKLVLRKMARMIIALRNKEWPDLEGS